MHITNKQGELTRLRADLRLREAADAAARKDAARLRADAAAATAAAAEDRRRAAAEHARMQFQAAALERTVRFGLNDSLTPAHRTLHAMPARVSIMH